MDTSTLSITWAGSLRGQVAAIETRRFIPEEQRVTVADLLDAVETHLATRGAKALTSFACHLKPVRAFFSGMRAIDVTTEDGQNPDSRGGPTDHVLDRRTNLLGI